MRAVLGKRVGVASTNRLDAASLQAACDAAVRAAGVAPEDPAFPGLPGPAPVSGAQRAVAATRAFDAEARAAAAGAIVAESASRGLTVAGKVRSAERTVAVANSLGVDVGAQITGAQATVLSMGAETGSGWASFLDADASKMDPAALGAQAAELALRSANPQALDPGQLPGGARSRGGRRHHGLPGVRGVLGEELLGRSLVHERTAGRAA